MSILYRAPLGESEIKMAAEVEKACLSTAWSESQIANLSESASYFCALENGLVCGIASMYAVAGEAEIMNLAVLPTHRRRGIANRLLTLLIDTAADKECEFITLEVATDNLAAISLYESFGFKTVGRRNGFYNGKDALIMEKKL